MKRLYPTPFPSLVRQLTKLDPLADPAYAPPALDNADQRPVDEQPSDLGVAWRVYRDTHAQGRLVNLGEWWAGWEIGAAEEEEREDEGEGEGWGGRTAGARGRKRARTGREEGGEGDEEEEGDDERASDEDEDEGGPERRKQARFLRAVGDLAHLGFIHPTTYKPEHVLKSVY
ncbi:hypothetical protein JCM3775_003301 [Rhodotorula graminis]